MRILSLLPAATECVAALGAVDQLVGVTHECDHPASVRNLPRVTASAISAQFTHEMVAPDAAGIDAGVRALAQSGAPLFTLDEARIRALQPDVILTQALCDVCAVSETDVRVLAASIDPPPRIVTLNGTTIEGIRTDVLRVAAAINCQDEADELLAGWDERLHTVQRVVAQRSAPARRVVVIEWPEPIFTAGHWVPELVALAGGVDVGAAPGSHSVVVTHDSLRAARPDMILVAPCGYTLSQAVDCAETMQSAPAWQWAVHCAWWAIDANGLTSRPGPRVVDAVESVARMLWPEDFSPLDPRHGRQLL
jgi:iron complex transport system substrate-binding protein